MSIDPELEARLASHLRSSADRAAGTTAPLDDVRRRGQRLRRRRRATAVVGAIAATGALTAAVAIVAGDLGGGAEELTVGPASPADGPDTGDRAAAPDDAATTVDDSRTVVRPAPVAWAGEAIDVPGERLVAWGDGLARVTTEWTDPAIAPMPDELIALFPEEVRPFLADGLPSSLDAGAELLIERPELADEVERVIAEHPEVAEHLYGGPSESRLIVETTTDGQTWTSAGELPVPGQGSGWVQFLMSTGDRLVAVVQEWPGTVDVDPAVLVASTTDLATWDTLEVLEPARTEPPPAGFRSDRWLQHADLAPDGSLVVTASDGITLDIESLLPAELRARTDQGYGMWTTDEGVVLSFDAGHDTVSDGDEPPAEPSWSTPGDAEEIVLTWAELGIDPELARTVEQSQPVRMWAGPIGAVRPTTPPPGPGWQAGVLAMPGGSVVVSSVDDAGRTSVWFSPDGQVWHERSLPLTAPSWVSSMVRVRDGMAFSVDGPEGLRWLHTDATASEWHVSAPLHLVGTDEAHVTLDPRWQAWHPAVGHVVLVRIDPIVAIEWSVEADGYRYETSLGPWPGARLVRLGVDGADDEIVVEVPPIGGDDLITWTGSGITVNDPVTGERLVTFPHEAIDAAIDAATGGVDPFVGSAEASTVVLVDPDGTGEVWYELDRFPAGEVWPSQVALAERLVLIGIDGPDGASMRSYRPG